MSTFTIQMIASILGTIGFAILFKLHPKKLWSVALLGGGCYGVYYLFATVVGTNAFVAAIISTSFVAVSAEFFARIMRSPTIIFIVPGIIPIVPGGALYRFMKELITGNYDVAMTHGKEALLTALGVAGGIILVSIVVNVVKGIVEKTNLKRAK